MEYGAAPPPGAPHGEPLDAPNAAAGGAAERQLLGAGGSAGAGGGDPYTGYMDMGDSDMGARGPDLYAARRLQGADDGIVRYLPPGPPLQAGEAGAPVDIGIICNSQRARFFPARQVQYMADELRRLHSCPKASGGLTSGAGESLSLRRLPLYHA